MLPISGQIDMSQINTELQLPATQQISLNDTAARTLAAIPTGAISMSNFHNKKNIYIPAGLIIMVTDNIIPAGWTRYSKYGNIVARGTYFTGTGPGYSGPSGFYSQTPTALVTNSSSGTHAATVHPSPYLPLTGTTKYRGLTTAAGNYVHTSIDPTAINWFPNSQGLIFIKASTNLSSAPANGMFFGTSAIPGFSIYNSSLYPYIYHNNNLINMGLSYILDSSMTAGSFHTHGVSKTAKYVDGMVDNTACTSSTLCGPYHIHTLSSTTTSSFNTILMRGLYKAASYNIEPGLIGMIDTSTIPVGWALCNGTNGTVDMRDYFIKFSITGTGTKSGTQSDSITNFSVTFSVVTDSYIHDHVYSGGYLTIGGSLGNNMQAGSASHTHTLSVPTWSAKNFYPVQTILNFIQYIG